MRRTTGCSLGLSSIILIIIGVFLALVQIFHLLEYTEILHTPPDIWLSLYSTFAATSLILLVWNSWKALRPKSHADFTTGLDNFEWPWVFYTLALYLLTTTLTLFLGLYYYRFHGYGPSPVNPLDTEATDRAIRWFPLHLIAFYHGLLLDLYLGVLVALKLQLDIR
jgi:hypothetical protein